MELRQTGEKYGAGDVAGRRGDTSADPLISLDSDAGVVKLF